jgi:hypothetical protein
MSKTVDYKRLKPEEIVNTIARLHQRITDRFPNSGLGGVCLELLAVAKNAQHRSEWISRPVYWLRILVIVITLLILGASLGSLYVLFYGSGDATAVADSAGTQAKSFGWADFIQVLEAGLNDVVLIGAAIFFLLTLETRYKRTRALKAIHELRSIAHIIDMHQLTKDPHRLRAKKLFESSVSPKLSMTPFLLRRYLDYCSEMLSLTGKIGALYVQRFDDGVALASASELETLTTGLSRKIWQKILILDSAANQDDDPRGNTITVP